MVNSVHMSGKVEILGNHLDSLTAYGRTDDILLSENSHRSSRCIPCRGSHAFGSECKGIVSTCIQGVAWNLRSRCENLPNLESALHLDHLNRLHIVLLLVLHMRWLGCIDAADLAIGRFQLYLV